jgi:ribosome-binding protein aMBF1 (putative translation factor)
MNSSTPGTPKQESIMATKRKFKSAAVQELYQELIGDDAAAQEEFEEGLVNIEAAQLIHDMRSKAGLSQRELARKVGTSASAINRLESADYEGHTIAMVRRVATALNRRLELRAVPVKTALTKTRRAAKAHR